MNKYSVKQIWSYFFFIINNKIIIKWIFYNWKNHNIMNIAFNIIILFFRFSFFENIDFFLIDFYLEGNLLYIWIE